LSSVDSGNGRSCIREGGVAIAKIVIVGAGVVGLGAGLLLCKDGHQVTILEKDAQAAPAGAEEIWGTWQRKGVNQFRLPHFFLARYRGLLDSELPEVKQGLIAAGAVRRNPVLDAPEAIRGSAREEDGAFECITGRRCVVEAAVASVAGRAPHLRIRRGAAAAGLVTGPSAHDGVPHVAGVRLDTGEEITADLVVDMTGRRSPLPQWLEAVGARPPHDELDDSGFVYYGRHFRSAGGDIPPALGGYLTHLGTISALTLPADNGTWSVTLVTSAKDKALYRLRDAAIWEKAVRSLPLVAHWLDGQPIDDRVMAMARIEDRHRNLMIDGAPVATGVVAVGDAWACSNPTVGRGASIGMLQAVLLRDTITAAGLDDPWKFACSFHRATAEMIEPWYRDTLAGDRHRLAEIDALIAGGEYRPRDPSWEIGQALANAAFKDPDCLRGFVSVAMVLSRAVDVTARPGFLDKVIALGAGWRDEPLPAPSRGELLSIADG
jgi:2-polyprenyl-6-methoxyphenol hydroxylase-like FAD-dependent oxidoreductase